MVVKVCLVFSSFNIGTFPNESCILIGFEKVKVTFCHLASMLLTQFCCHLVERYRIIQQHELCEMRSVFPEQEEKD